MDSPNFRLMTTIKSEKTPINASAQKVFEKISNLDNLKPLLEQIPKEQIPADKRDMFEKLKITSDSITIPAGPVGEIRLMITDLMPYSLIQLTGEGSPIPLTMQMEIDSTGSDSCDVVVSISLEVPAMIKPMISGPVKRIVDQFAQVLKAIPF